MLQDEIDALHCMPKMREYWVAQGCDGSMANSGVLPTEMALNESLHIEFQKAFKRDLQNMTEATRERVANQAFMNARQFTRHGFEHALGGEGGEGGVDHVGVELNGGAKAAAGAAQEGGALNTSTGRVGEGGGAGAPVGVPAPHSVCFPSEMQSQLDEEGARRTSFIKGCGPDSGCSCLKTRAGLACGVRSLKHVILTQPVLSPDGLPNNVHFQDNKCTAYRVQKTGDGYEKSCSVGACKHVSIAPRHSNLFIMLESHQAFQRGQQVGNLVNKLIMMALHLIIGGSTVVWHSNLLSMLEAHTVVDLVGHWKLL